jgi:hypothetical protein
LKNEITQLLDEFNIKNKNGLYYIRIEREDEPDKDYEYRKDITEDMIKGGHGGLSGIYDENQKRWNIYNNRTDNQANYDYEVQQQFWDKMVNRIPHRLGEISNYLFVISAVFLCVCILNKFYLKVNFSSK